MRKFWIIICIWAVCAGLCQASLLVAKGKVIVRGPTGHTMYNGSFEVILVVDSSTYACASYVILPKEKIAWYFPKGQVDELGFTSNGRQQQFRLEHWPSRMEWGANGDAMRVSWDVGGITAQRDVPSGLNDPARLTFFTSIRTQGLAWFKETVSDLRRVGLGSAKGVFRFDRKATALANDPDGNNGHLAHFINDLANDLTDQAYTIIDMTPEG